MTLAELRGGVMLRLGPKAAVAALVSAVDIEIHNAIDDVRSQARKMHVETLDRVARIDTVQNTDIYDWPEEAEEIRDVGRIGFGTMEQASFTEQGGYGGIYDWWCWGYGWGSVNGWVQEPGRKIRLLARPYTAVENALLVRFFPGPKRMVKEMDEPNLPRQIHENIIPQAIMRMASYDGIGLAHPASYHIYRLHMQERLELFLSADSVSGSANHVHDADIYYPGGGSY